MRKLIFIVAAAVFCLGLIATSSSSAKPDYSSSAVTVAQNPELDFILVNKTGYEIKEVAVGESGTGEWAPEDEILKGKPFPDGKSYKIEFKPKNKKEHWDLKATWIDDSSAEWLDLK